MSNTFLILEIAKITAKYKKRNPDVEEILIDQQKSFNKVYDIRRKIIENELIDITKDVKVEKE